LAVARENQNGWLTQRLSAVPGGKTVATHLQQWVGGALRTTRRR
jgi:hypothetical protein